MANFLIQRQTTQDSSCLNSSIIEVIQDLMVIYTLTKLSAEWLIFVDARVLTRKLWMDRRQMDGHQRMVSDHNSSLSTLSSGELKRKCCNHRCPDTVYFKTLLLIIYLSPIETLVCGREMSLIGSTSFGFAQNTIHDFQNQY